MSILISILFIFVVGFFSIKKPTIAVFSIIILLPTFLINWSSIGIPVNTLDMMIAVAVFMWAVTHVSDCKNAIQKNRIALILLLLWYISASASAFFTPNHFEALGILKSYFILPILFIFFLLATIQTKRDLKSLLLALAVLVFYNAVFAIAQKISPNGLFGINPITNPFWASPETFRATGLLVYPNALGLLLAPIIPLLLGIVPLLKNIYKKMFVLVSVLLGFVSILFASSKGALVGLAVASIIFIVISLRKQIRLMLIGFSLIVLLTIPYINTIVSKIGLSSYSAQLRVMQWKETMFLLRDSPITGAGLAGFQTMVAPYHTNNFIEIFLYPHNIFLNFWVELGLAGLLLLIILVLFTLMKSWILLNNSTSFAKKSLILSGIASMSVILVHGLVDVPYFKNDLSILFLLVWAWPLIIINIRKEKESK